MKNVFRFIETDKKAKKTYNFKTFETRRTHNAFNLAQVIDKQQKKTQKCFIR